MKHYSFQDYFFPAKNGHPSQLRSLVPRAASCEEDAWYVVVAEYATDQRSAMDTVEIVEDIWYKAEQFMPKQDRTCNPDTLGESRRPLSLRTNSDIQRFKHIHVS